MATCDPFGIVSRCRKVMESPTHVFLVAEKIPVAAERLRDLEIREPYWDEKVHYLGEEGKLLAYVFIVDTLNFYFWSFKGQEKWTIHHNGKTYDGYLALALAIKRAFSSGIPIWDPKFLKDIPPHLFFSLLEGKGYLSLIHRRYQNILELGAKTCEKFGGKFENIIEAAKGSAIEFVKIMVRNFESFNDSARYKSLEIPFYKRAQLLAWDLNLAFYGKGHGNFCDLNELTAFADYKLPQVLRELGVIEYGKELRDIIDQEITIPQGSPMEVEIRAATVLAVELLKREFQKMGLSYISPQIDYMLWSLGQREEFRKKPYHKTPTIYY